jgi:hypothetical protein
MTLMPRLISVGQIRTPVLIMLMWVSVLSPATTFAVVMEGLFEVEIPVPDESRAIRQAALADGLAEILVRISGDRSILQKIKPPSVNAYVKQFRYIAIESEAADVTEQDQANDPTIAHHKLWVQYNTTRIMDLLRKNSVPIWGEHRSQVVIWLAVRDGTNQYILRDRDISLIKTQANASFQRRGIPAIWPRNDARDQQQLRFADVWAGFVEPMQQASKRYTTGPVVSASMTWNGYSWAGDWSLLMARDSRRWALEEQDYNALISQAIDLIADAMGQKFAVLEATDTQGLQQILVEIDQVGSVKKFRHVQKYLSSLPVVRSVWLSQVEPERVAFKLTLRSEVGDFLKLIKADTRMAPLLTADTETVAGVTNTIYRFKLIN